MKKISVIIPCYNQGSTIEECVTSVLCSTYPNIEIIIVNDGSTNIETISMLEKISKKYPHVKIITIVNSGVCVARNIGIANATGEYILPLDADDKIDKTYIEKAAQILDNNAQIGIVYCEAQFFGGKNNKFNLQPATTFNMLIQNRIFSAAMFRKNDFQKIGGYKPEMQLGCEDWELWLSFLEYGFKPYQIQEILFFYRIHSNLRTHQALKPTNYLKIRLNIIKFHKKLYLQNSPICLILLALKIIKNFLASIYKILKIRKKIFRIHITNTKFHFLKPNNLDTFKRTPQIIVSLTTFGTRTNEVHKTINTILNQTLKPDKIILWLAEEEFKNKKLPDKLVNLTKYGLEIRTYQKDIKSYKKIIPVLKEYPNDIIVTADDDLYYSKNWLKLLYQSYLKNRTALHCHRAHEIKINKNGQISPYNEWKKAISFSQQKQNKKYLATSGAGLLIPPHTLNENILNEELISKLAPTADDLWIWAMAELQNTHLNIVEHNINTLYYVSPEREYGLTKDFTLYNSINSLGANDRQLKAILEHFPQITTQLQGYNNYE